MSDSNKQFQVAILDAGAQYAKVIDRRIRDLAVESVILPLDTPITELIKFGAIIISGGPESVYSASVPKYDPELLKLDKPILGICFGMQLMNYVHGGTVERKEQREDGVFQIETTADSLIFDSLPPTQEVLLTHGDTVNKVAYNFRVIAMSNDLISGIEHNIYPWYGVQFHPEVDLTKYGKEILSNFLFKVAKLQPNYTMEDRVQQAIKEIKSKVGDGTALVLVSGGVDSTVAAALVTKAIGADRVFALHIDTGFMRQNESSAVSKSLKQFGLKLTVVDATQDFLSAQTTLNGKQTARLDQTINPEEKRNIIGDTFMKITEREVKRLNLPTDNTFLVQGTLRPDLIESASSGVTSKAEVIKTHHNDTSTVRQLRSQGKIIEPLADYHKDEVRILGEQLGLPAEIVWRHPFPGPGLAIRILCADEPYITLDFDKIDQELKKFATNNNQISLLPVRSVGVQGDGRTYSYAAAISGKPDWPILMELAKKLPKTIHQLNRVVYLFGPTLTQPVTEITPTKLQPPVIEQLRRADDIVTQELLKSGEIRQISQAPVILIPVGFDQPGSRTIVIRTIITNDFMTGIPATPGKQISINVVNKMVDRILAEVPGISRVAYDLTGKPPATTEWE